MGLLVQIQAAQISAYMEKEGRPSDALHPSAPLWSDLLNIPRKPDSGEDNRRSGYRLIKQRRDPPARIPPGIVPAHPPQIRPHQLLHR